MFEKHTACDMSRKSEGSLCRLCLVSIERTVQSHLLVVHYRNMHSWSYIRGCHGEISDPDAHSKTSCFIRQRTRVRWQIRESPSEFNPILDRKLSKRGTVLLFSSLLSVACISSTSFIFSLFSSSSPSFHLPYLSCSLFLFFILFSLLLFYAFVTIFHSHILYIHVFIYLIDFSILSHNFRFLCVFYYILYLIVYDSFIPSVLQ